MRYQVKSTSGKYSVEVEIENVTEEQYELSVENLKKRLETQRNFEALAATFMEAIITCPNANPSDLWRHLVYRPYLAIKGDQSWKRAGGQALEIFFVNFYNSYLRPHGIQMLWLSRALATIAFREMGILEQVGRSKLDLALIGQCDDRTWRVFGGVHVKASIAERITDDVPASQAMMNANMLSGGYFSPLVTLDMKAFPPPHGDEVNRGELQFPQRRGDESDKRNYFERDGLFSVCYSYNLRTPPTPSDLQVAALIKTLDFSNPGFDVFMQDTIAAWNKRKRELCESRPPTHLFTEY